ncbi:MAG: M14 family metallopeptidase [Phycisphaerae bacterium]|nr:M14 family metallopeptidase [Phycisphaerae bacterium]
MNQFRENHKVNVKLSESRLPIRFSTFLALASCLFLGSCGANVQAGSMVGLQRPFVEGVDFNPAIPAPESVTGHVIAEKAVRYPALIRYLQALAKASERVSLTSYGQTHEGRTLYYLTITSPSNHKRLDQIKSNNAKLSDPRKLTRTEQANQLIDTLPAVAWMNYSIHGDELSSTDAAIYVAYHLAAAKDKATEKLLDQVVVHIVPLVNPDGRERYLSHLEQLTGVVSSPDLQSMQHQALWSRGRGNHYLFDLNRDWLVHIQPEVRDLAEVILSWNPHLLVDSHEQGAIDTYLFDPPQEPINIHLSPKVMEWRRRFSSDQAEAFDRYGWSYYTKDWYSDWAPIYTNSWANLQGAIGLLYEQARVDAASVKHPTGKEISYRETVHHHIVSTLANLVTLRENRSDILRDYFEDRQWATNEEKADGDTFLLPPCEDSSRWEQLVKLIKDHGIEVEFAQQSFNADDVTDMWGYEHRRFTFPESTLVVRLVQPHRRMLKTLCEFDPRFTDSLLLKERKELENHRETMIYDVTSWSLPLAIGIEAYWAKRMPEVKLQSKPSEPALDLPKLKKKSGYGYVIDFRNSNIYSILVRLFEKECHPRTATKPFTFEGREYKEGTVLLRGHENPDGLFEVLQKIASDFDINIHGVDSALAEDGPDLGAQKFKLLSPPRVAIASQWPVRSTSFGSVWYLLDYQLQLRSSPVNIQNIINMDLRKYNVLVLPDGSDLGRVLNTKAVEKIKRWIENGGTLIAIGNSAAFAAGKDRGLSSVRLKRDVLDKLAIYQEAVQRERNTRDITIDPNEIWGTKATVEKAAEDEVKKPDIEKMKRTDEWQRIFSPEGTFLSGTVNTEHWLGFGLQEKLPVMFWGSFAFMSKNPVRTVVRLDDKTKLRLSGLLWPEAKERLADTAYATVESIGRGQIILFATDPTYRMWLPGMQRLFLNSVLLGPGMGTSKPLPW